MRRPLPALAALAALACALALAGCGLGGGGAARPTATPATTPSTRQVATPATTPSTTPTAGSAPAGPSAAAIARTRRTRELPTPVPRTRVVGGWRTPAGAVAAFATTYVNWTAATVAARLRSLAAASVGQARSASQRAAAEVARDRELHEGGVANSGTVEAVAPVHGRANAYAVVTRERTTAARGGAYEGLRPAWHVSVATVTRLPGGLWVLSGWQPEN